MRKTKNKIHTKEFVRRGYIEEDYSFKTITEYVIYQPYCHVGLKAWLEELVATKLEKEAFKDCPIEFKKVKVSLVLTVEELE